MENSFEQLLNVVRKLQTSSHMWVECEEVDSEEDGEPVVSLRVMAGEDEGIAVPIIEVEADSCSIAAQIVLSHLQQSVTPDGTAKSDLN